MAKAIESHELPAEFERRVRRLLLQWFKRARRDLPWRRDRDPYRIWVSEIMLQQTQVATVVPFFERFLLAFPSVADLARADEQAVLRLWEGLGYYRRARNLHQAARLVVAQYGGKIPHEPVELAKLPGIGRYTMGAVLSQAFDLRLPILETNSERVLCRLFARTEDPKNGSGRHWLWQAAEALLPMRRIGEFNQALMELGALVCLPVAPRCTSCPLKQVCVACRLGIQEEIPPRASAPETLAIQEVAVIVRRGTRLLLAQRGDQGRWAGLWEFPHAPLEAGETHDSAAARILPLLTGVHADIGPEWMTVRHSITHHRITLICFEARYRSGRFRPGFYRAGKWVVPEQLPAYPVSSPQRRLATAILEPARQRRFF
ncbi:MAG TPA: A/G-specific adenine glycosylase [Gemmataceae bacterium]|nr:A/G-specific adenine glycosylase [Gemmataceae bacterium]